MKDKDMMGRTTTVWHGRKRGTYTCNQAAKILVLAALVGLVIAMILKEIL